jgi:hypothetical protein
VRPEAPNRDPLASCHGYIVMADDGLLGEVVTPLFGSDSSAPDYLAVRTDGAARRAFVPASLVRFVDDDDHLVRVHGNIWELSHLPDSLPMAPRL